MKTTAFHFRYTKSNGEIMAFFVKAQMTSHATVKMIKDSARAKIEHENGEPCTDLTLVSQNDPDVIRFLEAGA